MLFSMQANASLFLTIVFQDMLNRIYLDEVAAFWFAGRPSHDHDAVMRFQVSFLDQPRERAAHHLFGRAGGRDFAGTYAMAERERAHDSFVHALRIDRYPASVRRDHSG